MRVRVLSPNGRFALHHGIILLVLSLCALRETTSQARIDDTLPQLIGRFGSRYEVEGSEEDGTLRVKFRSDTYNVDVLMSRDGSEVVAKTEIYYSKEPLQSNGQPPDTVLRGIMNEIAASARWKAVRPDGSQWAVFLTQDGTCKLTVLPPNRAVVNGATFTMIVTRIKKGPSLTAGTTEAAAGNQGDENKSTPQTPKMLPKTPGQSTSASRTETGRLVARGVLPFAVSEAVYDRMASYLGNSDERALEQLERAKLIGFLKPGTQVRIVESKGFVISTKERVQIVGTAVEVWVSPSEVVDESNLPAKSR